MKSSTRRGIILYLEYQSVCPIAKLAPPAPSPAKGGVSLFLNEGGGGGQQSIAFQGAGGANSGGANSDGWRDSLALCNLLLYYLCINPTYNPTFRNEAIDPDIKVRDSKKVKVPCFKKKFK